jgi:hypothetical protein
MMVRDVWVERGERLVRRDSQDGTCRVAIVIVIADVRLWRRDTARQLFRLELHRD